MVTTLIRLSNRKNLDKGPSQNVIAKIPSTPTLITEIICLVIKFQCLQAKNLAIRFFSASLLLCTILSTWRILGDALIYSEDLKLLKQIAQRLFLEVCQHLSINFDIWS